MNLPARICLYFDGACGPTNPGTGSYGWIALCTVTGKELGNGHGKIDGESTNNTAEYAGLEYGLWWLLEQGWKGELTIYGDSMLVVNQVVGKWGFRKPHLKVLCERCLKLLKQLGSKFTIRWIPREQNTRCDQLSKVHCPVEAGSQFRKKKQKKKPPKWMRPNPH